MATKSDVPEKPGEALFGNDPLYDEAVGVLRKNLDDVKANSPSGVVGVNFHIVDGQVIGYTPIVAPDVVKGVPS